MKIKDIRSQFFNFFQKKGHVLVNSSSVIPGGDKSLLFTNAGMNQFKDVFLGFKPIKNSRVISTQKCIRVSGKHNDLEEVGVDTYHHTFFEMLGNWSFNDYYKKETILFAWELLTDVWKLPKDRLFVTYYEEDIETKKLWLSLTDVQKNNVLPFDKKDNFWEMGNVGPCGPCTEIHFYRGNDADFMDYYKDEVKGVNGVDSDFMEIWNLVFIEFNRNEKGELDTLDHKHVDTGMGLERIACVLQNKTSNYDIDLFQIIIKEIERISHKKYEGIYEIPIRVIADHIRTLVISIGDGVVPSNTSRGYVIRRILRRAYRYGRQLEIQNPFLHLLVDVVIDEYKDVFEGLIDKKEYIKEAIFLEEKIFDKTLNVGLALLDKIVETTKSQNLKTISGKDVFILYDRYGFPFDLTSLILKEKDLIVHEEEFKIEMEQQKIRSKGVNKVDFSFDLLESLKNYPETKYLGESSVFCDGILLKVFDVKDSDEKMFVFDKTVFYGESGGQIGDVGFIDGSDVSIRINNVQKMEGYFIHFGVIEKGEIKENEIYKLMIDFERRKKIRKNHTSVHLLHKVLRDVLGDHVRQAGSFVGDKKARFDFNHSHLIGQDILNKIERKTNELINKNSEIFIDFMTYDEAVNQKKALAFFDEKYPETVRVVSIGDKNAIVELCGGSHVNKTSEIGFFKILKESSVSFGIRRIEFITNMEVYDYVSKREALDDELFEYLKVSSFPDLFKKLKDILNENKILNKKLKKYEQNDIKEQINLLKYDEIKGGVHFYFSKFLNIDLKNLREEIDSLKNKYKSVIIFSVKNNDKNTILVSVSKEIENQFQADKIIKKIIDVCDGKGGGKASFAQANVKNEDKVIQIIEEIKENQF